MKMVTAILGPGSARRVVEALESQGLSAVARISVLGHGRDMGCTAGSPGEFELHKEMITTVVADDQVPHIISLIRTYARKGEDFQCSGRAADGKIFVTDVIEEYTILTREQET
ncbi:MAG: P-II family nitrogen regulator [Methanoregulaceae archaeon]|nr:P-II family nitrogen regulator [Methanoregulaceae archaeon]